MDLIKIMNERYSTKKFDSTKKISNENMEKVYELLRLSTSSVNSQPWHFIVASTDEAKQRLSKSTQNAFSSNNNKILEASHVLVLCTKTYLEEEYLMHIVDKEYADGRFANEEEKNKAFKGRNSFISLSRVDYKKLQNWMQKQVYINLGNLLLGLAILGIDALPMEGFDSKILDEELKLAEKGLTSTLVVAIGYRAEDDANAKLPKSRLSRDELFTMI